MTKNKLWQVEGSSRLIVAPSLRGARKVLNEEWGSEARRFVVAPAVGPFQACYNGDPDEVTTIDLEEAERIWCGKRCGLVPEL